MTNPLLIVQSLTVPEQGLPLVLDPHWGLLAWSAAASGTIRADRTTTLELVKGIAESKSDRPQDKAQAVAFTAIFHMLTLLPYSTSQLDATDVDPFHPLLQRNATIYVYAYSLGSRTSYVGVTVAIAGAVIVLAQAALGFSDLTPSKSISQLLIAALEHPPQDEFGSAATESTTTKIPFQVFATHEEPAGVSFKKTL